jgi:hypothetical protein
MSEAIARSILHIDPIRQELEYYGVTPDNVAVDGLRLILQLLTEIWNSDKALLSTLSSSDPKYAAIDKNISRVGTVVCGIEEFFRMLDMSSGASGV